MTGRHIAVLGPMGIGKTTTAEALAAELGRPVRDSDTDIEAMFGMPGRELVADRGVPELHRAEAAALLDALTADTPSVISAAASIVEHEGCRAALAERAFTVVLEADFETVERRAATGAHRRVLPHAEFEALVARRAPLFAAVADLTLDASATTDELVELILAEL